MIKRTYLLLYTILISLTGITQSITAKVTQQLDSFAVAYPQEKVFLHTDKNQYLAGESIWFNTYTLLDNKLSYLSKVIYVDLVNANGVIVEKRMLPITHGTAKGDILINKETPSGVYRLNAYTLWMLNFPDFIFSKDISIINNDLNKISSVVKNKDFQVHFFPEGGELITGVNNKVAFKTITNSGKPISAKGILLDKYNKELTTISTFHDGMGIFEISPAVDEIYRMKFIAENQVEKVIDLPASKKEGVALTVNNESPSRLFIQLQRANQNTYLYNELWIIAQMNEEVVYSGKVNFDEGQNSASISKKNLPTGIIHITIFNSSGIPLVERLAFINNQEEKDSLLIAKKINLSPRTENEYSINLKAFNGIKASVAITNLAIDSTIFQSNIFTQNFLNSELKGQINQPSFYFKDKSIETVRALDLLMMTHGWRRFKWNELLVNRFPSLEFPVESGIAIAGKLSKANGKTGIKNGRIDFITKAEDSTTIVTTVNLSDENKFYISDLNFRKNATIYYQGTNIDKQKEMTQVDILPAYFDTLKYSTNKPESYFTQLKDNSTINKFLSDKKTLDSAEGKILSEVIVRSKKISPLDSLNKIYTSDLYRNSDQTIPMDKGNYFNIWQFLQRNVAGLSIDKNQYGQVTVFFKRYIGLDNFSTPGELEDHTTNISFLLNEVPVSKDVIETIDPTDIDLIKVWSGTSAMALGASRGMIGIYTQKGKSIVDWRNKGFNYFRKEGYSISREFYNIDYSLPIEYTSQDKRPTLYWNPQIKVDNTGNATIRFYNDDITKSYKIVINGIDKDGKMLTIEKIIN